MAERFAYSTGTITIANGASSVTGTGTAWSGRDRAGSKVIAYPAAAAPIMVGTVAEVDPRGVYENLTLPLVHAYNGATLTDVAYEIVDGPAIANGATQAAVFARYAAHIEQNMGLVGNNADAIDFALVPENSLFVDDVTSAVYQWRGGVLNIVRIVGITEAGILLTFDASATADADPGEGMLRASDLDLSAAAFLYISKTDRNGDSIAAFLDALDASTNPSSKGIAVIAVAGGVSTVTFEVGAVTDHTEYVRVAVSGHSGAEEIAAAASLGFQFSRTADGGVTGPGPGTVAGEIAVFTDAGGQAVEGSGIVVGTMAGQDADDVDITGGTITGMPAPSSSSDVATKGYVDGLVLNVGKRTRVHLASTANVDIASAPANLDGIAMAAGKQVMLKNQSAGAENGIRIFTAAGAPLARAPEFDSYGEHPGSLVVVEEGATQADTMWFCTSDDGGTLDTTAIAFSRIRIDISIPVTPTQGGTGIANNNSSTITIAGAFGLTFTIGAARNVTINGNATLNDWFDQSVKAAASPTFVNVVHTGYDEFPEIASPANPAANSLRLFAKDVSSSTHLFVRDSAGTEVDLSLASSGVAAASQAELEAASSTSVFTSPGRQEFHPSAAKAWVKFNSAGTVAASYNVTSITDSGVGQWVVNIATDFSGAQYSGVGTTGLCGGGGNTGLIFHASAAPAAGTYSVGARSTGNAFTDPSTPDSIFAQFFGDQ